jgi:hypothetical protein
MPLIEYREVKFGPVRLKLIDQANEIITEYQRQGFDLTLRQLYYQFVARGLIANKLTEYKRLGEAINEARIGGLVDWDAITDRTRNLHQLATWTDPADRLHWAARTYRTDKWESQDTRVEVWVEKEALAGVFQDICDRLEVPMFACRGYVSQSEMHAAAKRLEEYADGGQSVVLLHFGDHDPSGIDMTRDILERLDLFSPGVVEVRRLALNMDQVRRYNPPPNPAKLTDSRCEGYMAIHGNQSWELDALDPTQLAALVRDEVEDIRDPDRWKDAVRAQEKERRQLTDASEHWEDVLDWMRRNGKTPK